MKTRNQARPLVENILESSTACLLAMVQGNVFALTFGHWLVASRTGLVAGAVATMAVLLARTDRRWAVALILATATAAVDFFSHRPTFGAFAVEAVVTGAAAGLLSLGVSGLWRLARGRSRDAPTTHS